MEKKYTVMLKDFTMENSNEEYCLISKDRLEELEACYQLCESLRCEGLLNDDAVLEARVTGNKEIICQDDETIEEISDIYKKEYNDADLDIENIDCSLGEILIGKWVVKDSYPIINFL